jgi:hypothetical protein
MLTCREESGICTEARLVDLVDRHPLLLPYGRPLIVKIVGEGHGQESAVTERDASSGQCCLEFRVVQKRKGLKHICTVLCPI